MCVLTCDHNFNKMHMTLAYILIKLYHTFNHILKLCQNNTVNSQNKTVNSTMCRNIVYDDISNAKLCSH